MNEQRFRIISKEGRKWKVQHFDGQITYHKTKKAAKEYKHTFDPSRTVVAPLRGYFSEVDTDECMV